MRKDKISRRDFLKVTLSDLENNDSEGKENVCVTKLEAENETFM